MEGAAQVRSLRVLTINTHKGFTLFNRRFMLHELRDAIRSTAADLVFLQEVQGEQVRHALRWLNWPTMPHYEFLADSIWSDFAYGRNAVYPHGHHGNALLSKYPIVRSRNHDVSTDHGGEPRGLLHCVLGVPAIEGGLHAICVHLGLREVQRKRQLECLVQMIEQDVPRGAPLLVAGDFNDWRRTAHHVLHRAGLREVWQHGRSPRTFPARLPVLALDRIYVRDTAAHEPLALPRRPWAHLSDHVPLAADVRLP